MFRKFGISTLVLCFFFSSINLGLATEVFEIPPILVQPYDWSGMNQQFLQIDRENQENAAAIEGLMRKNQAPAPTIPKKRISKYQELIDLTIDADDITSIGQNLVLRRDLIGEKYKILDDLKNEMTALNDKLGAVGSNQQLQNLVQQQKAKVEILTQRLGELDQRISGYDDTISQKDRQIAQLKDNLTSDEQEAINNEVVIKSQHEQIDNLKQEAGKYISLNTKVGLDLPPIIVRPTNTQQPLSPSADNSTVAAKDQVIAQLENKLLALSQALKVKDDSIRWLNQVAAVTKKKSEYYQLTAQRYQMSLQQVQREVQEIKDDVSLHNNDFSHLEKNIDFLSSQVNAINIQLAKSSGQTSTIQTDNSVSTQLLKDQLAQKNEQLELLKTELEDKITEAQAQAVLVAQMKTQLQEDQKVKLEADTLKQQLLSQQDKTEQLKAQLDNKSSQSDQMTAMADDYQKKLEAKDSVNNKQLEELMTFKNYQAMMEKQVTDLNARLQDKEAQVIKIKEELYDVQQSNAAKDKDSQVKDLSLSMMQEAVQRLKKQLEQAPGQLPSVTTNSDEIDFLRKAYKEASVQLKQKDDMLLKVQANADEYKKEFLAQSKEFQSLKDQLAAAQQELQHKDKVQDLRVQLKEANVQIKDLQDQLDQLRAPGKNSPIESKLSQALDKINEQGKVIYALSQKLQDCSQNLK